MSNNRNRNRNNIPTFDSYLEEIRTNGENVATTLSEISLQERISLPSICVRVSDDDGVPNIEHLKKIKSKSGISEYEYVLNSDLLEIKNKLNEILQEESVQLILRHALSHTEKRKKKCIVLKFSYIPESNSSPYGIDYTSVRSRGTRLFLTYDDLYVEDRYKLLECIKTAFNEHYVVYRDSPSVNLSTEGYEKLIGELVREEITTKEFIRSAYGLLFPNNISPTTDLPYDKIPGMYVLIRKGRRTAYSEITKPLNSEEIIEDDLSHIAYEMVIKNFIAFHDAKIASQDPTYFENYRYSTNYVSAIGYLTLAYYKEFNPDYFSAQGVSVEDISLNSRVDKKRNILYRADLSYDLIDNEEVVRMCKSNEMFRSLYTILLTSLRYVKYPDRNRNVLNFTDEEYESINRIVMTLGKKAH